MNGCYIAHKRLEKFIFFQVQPVHSLHSMHTVISHQTSMWCDWVNFKVEFKKLKKTLYRETFCILKYFFFSKIFQKKIFLKKSCASYIVVAVSIQNLFLETHYICDQKRKQTNFPFENKNKKYSKWVWLYPWRWMAIIIMEIIIMIIIIINFCWIHKQFIQKLWFLNCIFFRFDLLVFGFSFDFVVEKKHFKPNNFFQKVFLFFLI